MMKNYTYSSVTIVIIRILKNLNLRIKQGQFHSDQKFIYTDNKKCIRKHLLILVLASTGKPFFNKRIICFIIRNVSNGIHLSPLQCFWSDVKEFMWICKMPGLSCCKSTLNPTINWDFQSFFRFSKILVGVRVLTFSKGLSLYIL